MAIRNETDALSRAVVHKRDYFLKQDSSATGTNFNRFVYMKPGNKDLPYDWRLNFNNVKIDSTTFIINQEKFVNRPDAIAYDVYGNAKYWWIIALFNEIQDPFIEFYKGRELKIPDFNFFKKTLGF
jgi:hypothetical protein